MTEEIKDWRGTPIEPGVLVIYGAAVGRSVTMVEGEVDSFTPAGRVRVKVIRRSYGGGSKPVVDVGPDRLTVVTELPPTKLPTQEEDNLRREAWYKSDHDWDYYYGDTEPPCNNCGLTFDEAYLGGLKTRGCNAG